MPNVQEEFFVIRFLEILFKRSSIIFQINHELTFKSPLIFFYGDVYFIVDNYTYETSCTDFFNISFLSDNCFVVA